MERTSHDLYVIDGKIEQDKGHGMQLSGVFGGVDLNLDEFDLSEAGQHDGSCLPPEPLNLHELSIQELEQMILDAGADLPDPPYTKEDLIAIVLELYPPAVPVDFWEAIGMGDGDGDEDPPPSPFSEEDRNMFRIIFNPFLSDRRGDADRFVPPPFGNQAYMEKLHMMVADEIRLKSSRRQEFISESFNPGDPGPSFPHSWKPFFKMMCGDSAARDPDDPSPGHPQRAPDSVLTDAEDMIAPAFCVFDKGTEDGTRYRIYRREGLEARTLQEWDDEKEQVQAVFNTTGTERRRTSSFGATLEGVELLASRTALSRPHST